MLCLNARPHQAIVVDPSIEARLVTMRDGTIEPGLPCRDGEDETTSDR